MAKLKIYTFPDPVLAQRAQPIARVEKPVHRFADDLLETMYEAPGIGLAANQVGILDRIVVVDVDYDLESDPSGEGTPLLSRIKNRSPLILINPEIVHREGTTAIEEACLSVPEFEAEVKRAEKIKLRYQDIDGLEKTLSAEGLLAIAIQHELDHLDGKLFIDRLSPLKKEMVRKRLRAERIKREQLPLDLSVLKPTKKGF